MLAKKLQIGDEIRVIAPSRSASIVYPDMFEKALQTLTALGFHVTFSKNCREVGKYSSSSIQSRVDDLHDAFADQNVKAVLSVIGGFNVNQILPYLDYKHIQRNPKILCGFSDITALLHAVYAKTGLVTYNGTHFSTFGVQSNLQETITYFQKCLMLSEPYILSPSSASVSYRCIQPGVCKGTVIGGNLCTLNLLQGTSFMPSVTDAVLFIEDDNIVGEFFLQEFDRNLESLIQAIGINSINGIVFGRFDPSCGVTAETILDILSQKRQLSHIPVVCNVDFGHVTPLATFPIGGKVQVNSSTEESTIKILLH